MNGKDKASPAPRPICFGRDVLLPYKVRRIYPGDYGDYGAIWSADNEEYELQSRRCRHCRYAGDVSLRCGVSAWPPLSLATARPSTLLSS